MTARFRRPEPDPTTARRASTLVAVLYLLAAGLVVYFRVGPFHRVVARAGAEGADIPGWVRWAMSAGTLLLAGVFVWRARVRLRPPRPSPPTGANPPADSV